VEQGGKVTGALALMEKKVKLQLANEILRLNKGLGNLEIYLSWYTDTLI